MKTPTTVKNHTINAEISSSKPPAKAGKVTVSKVQYGGIVNNDEGIACPRGV